MKKYIAIASALLLGTANGLYSPDNLNNNLLTNELKNHKKSERHSLLQTSLSQTEAKNVLKDYLKIDKLIDHYEAELLSVSQGSTITQFYINGKEIKDPLSNELIKLYMVQQTMLSGADIITILDLIQQLNIKDYKYLDIKGLKEFFANDIASTPKVQEDVRGYISRYSPSTYGLSSQIRSVQASPLIIPGVPLDLFRVQQSRLNDKSKLQRTQSLHMKRNNGWESSTKNNFEPKVQMSLGMARQQSFDSHFHIDFDDMSVAAPLNIIIPNEYQMREKRKQLGAIYIPREESFPSYVQSQLRR
ncbi:UNKNOWN [Stylonychia lemnae]|uniref:Uncharacterized protein n=1 Tax=Stylonychia lemnae TaxID=5949 RepID=A0A078AG24_STYLE|nr:UNKNOWN [Stylonychia lemnae]|eukprot:CDW80397.1 UNKNOWN [Stylonychia lemnae]